MEAHVKSDLGRKEVEGTQVPQDVSNAEEPVFVE